MQVLLALSRNKTSVTTLSKFYLVSDKNGKILDGGIS
jgi:hypothetical protein